jgi:Tol biopolymer transport system component
MSNYFARYSPDGKWIVFTQSKTGIMLQPDSQLFIVPSEGGRARKMNCNRKLFNSWHSWSPNGKWLLFSSKVNSPFTEIFMTHIDENGNDSPPVLLSRFSDSAYAANVPEFVNIKPDAINEIRVQ